MTPINLTSPDAYAAFAREAEARAKAAREAGARDADSLTRFAEYAAEKAAQAAAAAGARAGQEFACVSCAE